MHRGVHTASSGNKQGKMRVPSYRIRVLSAEDRLTPNSFEAQTLHVLLSLLTDYSTALLPACRCTCCCVGDDCIS